MPPKDRDMAMVFQNYALYPHMTVFENMSFGLRLKRFPKDEIKRRVNEAARILDIAELLDRKPRQLSGGQRQRVAMGRAIVRNPKVFLFDEPLSNLDAKLRVQMRTEIKRVHQKVKTTTVYVTHDQIEAMTLADRVVVMNGGLIEQVGTPHELYHPPKTRFVAGFIGSPAMNFIPCRLEQNGSGLLVRLSEQLRVAGAGRPRRALPPARRQAAELRTSARAHHRAARHRARHPQRVRSRARRHRADGHGDAWCSFRSMAPRSAHGSSPRACRRPGSRCGCSQPEPHAPDRSGDPGGAVIWCKP